MITKKEITEITNIIKDTYVPDKVILFGSYANGNEAPGSDLDILIISEKEKEKPRWQRGLQLLYKLRKYHFSKDILIYSQEEIDRWKSVDVAFITEINKYGLILYEK